MKNYNINNTFCKKCGLYKGIKHPCIIGSGNINSKVLVLGEYPGKTEDEQGYVFTGTAGNYLRYSIDSTGLDCFMSNALLCLDGKTQIKTKEGNKRLNWVVKNKYNGEVLSIDNNGILVWKKIIGWYKSPIAGRTVYRLSIKNGKGNSKAVPNLILTEDHPVLTKRGFVRVDQLLNSDLIATGTPAPGPRAKQLIIGSILGDAHVSKHNSFEERHSSSQTEYILLKGRLLKNFNPRIYDGLSNGFPYIAYRIPSSLYFKDLRKYWYNSSPRIFPIDQLKQLNSFGLAIFYMDDGYGRYKTNSPKSDKTFQPEIALGNIGNPQEVSNYFNSIGYDTYVVFRGTWRLLFRYGKGIAFLKDIIEFVPLSMRYKFPDSLKNEPFNESIYSSEEVYTYWKEFNIEKIDYSSISKSTSMYCIDVEDTANFVTPSGVVHNCRPTDKKGTACNPTPTNLDCCKVFTIDLIKELKPKVVLALGTLALQQLIKTNLNIETARGKTFYHPELDVIIIPTYHPSFVLKLNDKRYKNEFLSDLALARSYAVKPPSRRIPSIPKTLTDPIDIEEYFQKVLQSVSVAIDLETTNVNPRKDRITDISLCCEIGKGIHIGWKYIADNVRLLSLLKEILLSTTIEKVFHNADFDVQFLRAIGLDVAFPWFDTMIAYHTITMTYEGGKAASLYRLKTMTWFLTQEGGYESVLDEIGGIVGAQNEEQGIEQTKIKKQPKPKDKDRISLFDSREIARISNIDADLEECLQSNYTYIDSKKKERLKTLNLKPKEFYSAMDADVTYRIYKYLKVRIDETYSYPYYNIIMPLCKTLMRIHENGIQIDLKYIDKLIEENEKNANKVKQEFFKKAGYEFNLNSVDQLGAFLFNKLGITPNPKMISKKSQKPSTDEEAIEYYSKQKPILKKILEYRGIVKQTSTYLEGYKTLVDENSRVYPAYFQIGTASGRLSCREPNLQNLPGDNRIRSIVVPKEGNKICIVDLSQVELRILAMISEDQNMIYAFNSGHDFHTYTACVMFDIPVDKFDKNNPEHKNKRSNAKAINFGIAYGMRAESLAKDLEISNEKAFAFMKRFFSTYPKVAQWMEYTKSFARSHGYVENIYGRRRYLPNIFSGDPYIREGAERQSINTPIQSSAGDICFIGLVRFQNWLDETKKKSRLVGTVHDSILVEVPYDEVTEVSDILVKCMTKDIPKVTVELKADVDVLDKWQE